jgi:pimeloyl-ACP methyl ester carboxylesterase
VTADRLTVHRHGEGADVVVVLHGGPGARGSVSSLARLLAAPHRTVLEPWQRRSGGPPLTVRRHVADLAAVAPPRAKVVGWSWGAMLGLSYAAAYPDRVAALLLLGCGTYDETSREAYQRTMSERLGEEGRKQMGELRAALAAAATSAARDRLLAEIAALAERAQAVDPLPGAGDRVDVDARGHEETWRDALRLQAAGREPAAFAAIVCPVAMFHGAGDPHPGAATRDRLVRFVPRLLWRPFPRGGHRLWEERAARSDFLAALGDWLDPAEAEGAGNLRSPGAGESR